MATETISTRIILEGEAEYRRKLKDINAQYSLLKSELKEFKNESAGSANALATLEKAVEILCRSQESLKEKLEASNAGLQNAQKNQEKYAQKIAEVQEKLEQVMQRQEDLGDITEDTAEEHARLTAELEHYQQVLQNAETGMQKATERVEQWQGRVNRAENSLARLSQELENNQGYLEEARQNTDQVADSIDEYGHRVRSASDNSKGLGKAVDSFAKALKDSGVNAALGTVKDVLLDCVKASSQFESAVVKVGSIAGANAVPLETLKDQMIQLSNEMGISASEIAASTYNAVAAGIDAADSVQFVEQATKLAASGFIDTKDALDILSTAVNTYGLETSQAAQLSDYLITTQNLGKTTVAELASNMEQVIPAAAAYHVEMDNLSAAYAVLTSHSISTVDSTTYLKEILNELGDSGSTVSKVLQEHTGSSFATLTKKGMSLGDIMKILGDSVGGNKKKFTELWKSSEAGVGALSLLEAGTEEYNSVLKRMDESTGAADRAFEEMADTTESAKKRMETAFENLKAAIGDQLSPALQSLSEAGAEAFTWATGFVQDNPELVSLITAVAVGLGTMTIAVTTYSAVKAAAIPIIASFNQVLKANPVVLVATAILSLTTAIGAFIATAGDSESETEALVQKTKELRESVDETIVSYGEKQEEIKKDSAVQKELASELSKLIGQENKTVESKHRISEIVALLNKEVPGLSLAYDEQTDSLNMTTDALDKLLEKQAEEENYNAAVEARAELLKQRAEAAEAVEEAERRLAEVQSQMTEDMEEHSNTLLMQEASGYSQVKEEVEGCRTAYEEAKEALASIDTQLASSNDVITQHQLSVAGMSETTLAQRDALLESAAALGENSERYANVREEIAGLDEAYLTHVAEQQVRIEEIQEQQQLLRDEYEATKKKIEENLTAEMGMFETMSTKADRSIEELMGSLDSQLDYMDNYTDNISKLIEWNVDKGLIQKLSDGSQESAKILQALVDDGGEHIHEFVEKFNAVEEGKKTFTDNVLAMQTNFTVAASSMAIDAVTAVVSMNLREQAYEAGLNNVKGFIEGSSSMRRLVITTYSSLASAAIEAARKKFNQNSPSREFHKIGANNVIGAIEGTEEERPALERTYENAAQVAMQAYEKQAIKMKQEMEAKQYISYTSSAAIRNRPESAYPEFGLSQSTAQAIGRLVEKMEQNQGGSVTQNVTIVNPERTPAENARALRKVGRELAFGG
ncbi:phage tail tape measure protein [Hominifimenecus sp. rT4P-3]|uniref:phage tail tape measure protein n=1 Tax=Hominifimenecus sp. rT4P-3 TaxID=3242979 RepID=UPI003DA5D3B4